MPPPPVKTFTHGPFVGMRYNSDPTVHDSSHVYYAKNVAVADPPMPGPYKRVFSFFVTDTGLAAVPQLLIGFAALGQTVVSIAGQLYQLGSYGAPWVSQATITGAGATFSTTARTVWAVEFNGYLILHDGVNRPFAVDTAGAVTNLSNAPASVSGKPTVYYGKLFFIKGTDTKTLVWSEENQINTGYEAGGYNNAWTLTQSGPGPIVAIAGSNTGLYYWRPRSIGVIRGAVNTAFVAAGTHDTISSRIGAASSIVQILGEDFYFVDKYCRPCLLKNGSDLVFLGSNIPDAFVWPGSTPAGMPYGYVQVPGSVGSAESRIGYDPSSDMVVFNLLDVNSRNRLFAFSGTTGEAMCELDPDPTLNPPWSVGWFLDSSVPSGAAAATMTMMTRGSSGNVFTYTAQGDYTATGSTHQPTTWKVQLAPMGVEAPAVQWRGMEASMEFDLLGGDASAALTLAVNNSNTIGDATGSVGSVTVGAQATRTTYMSTMGLGTQSLRRFIQLTISGNDHLAYWALNRATVKAEPVPLGPAVT